MEPTGGQPVNPRLTCLGFKWWKCRALTAAEQREHRPLRGQRGLLALGYFRKA